MPAPSPHSSRPASVDTAVAPALSAALERLGSGLTFAGALPDLAAALDARGAAVVALS